MLSGIWCVILDNVIIFFFSSRRLHTRYWRDWISDVCSSDLGGRRVRLHDGPGPPTPGRVRFPVKRIRFHPNVPEEVRAIEKRAALNILSAIYRYAATGAGRVKPRSEEHTSELQ